MIVRIWRGITPKEQADAYLGHLQQTVLPALAGQPGLRGAWVLRRVHGDRSNSSCCRCGNRWMRAFAGDEPERAVYFAEDDKFLLDMEPLVHLYEVADSVEPAR